eukprot:NODE_8790_length_682_cov_118.602862_g8530_i0.p1 GENE.NODE_8790_length_682_cov_118.602862_g8530_i0~~NODE_8790_length_682_cov_118.602862_g8530_i0.p1  ORF type:complete len:192 (-),score=7.79 NODE_8790_length_682_cov_118.602862_g8530_i0:48-623(-)
MDTSMLFGDDPSSTTDEAELDICGAAERGDISTIRHLLQRSANIEERQGHGWTALHLACRHDRVDVVRLLLSHKANVNDADGTGVTPLHRACINNRTAVVGVLLHHRADVTALAADGRSALDLAPRLSPIVALLRRELWMPVRCLGILLRQHRVHTVCIPMRSREHQIARLVVHMFDSVCVDVTNIVLEYV